MTTIHKLSVRGVRSYSPNDECVIRFFQPLTVICGKNGSGKTTIIEALKYITAGEMPPMSDKGKSFVHDPDACGEPAVKGQIKLGFKTASGKQMVAIKSFQVTKQKSKRTFRLIDSVISTHASEGQVSTMSYKCARMDELMQQALGVPKAILENVIFCHQFDAHWPFSDDKELKRRFDDIFAATKYTKAMEAMKKFRADQMSASKDMGRDQEVLLNNMETSQKLQSDLSQSEKRRSDLERQWRASQAKMEQLTAELEHAQEAYAAVCNCARQIEDLQRSLVALEAETSRAHDRISCNFEDDDDSLTAGLHSVEQQIEERREQREKCRSDFTRAEENAARATQEFQHAAKAAGRVEVLTEQLETREREMNELFSAVSSQYGIPLQTDPHIFLEELETRTATLTRELSEFRNSSEQELRSIDRSIEDLSKKEAMHEHAEKTALERDQIETVKAQQQQQQFSVCASQVAAMRAVRVRLGEAERSLQEQQKKMDESPPTLRVDQLASQLSESSARLRNLAEEQRAAADRASAEVNLNVCRQAADSARSRLENAERSAAPVLEQAGLHASSDFDRELLQAKASQRQASQAFEAIKAELASLNGREDALRQQVEKAERGAKEARDAVCRAIGRQTDDTAGVLDDLIEENKSAIVAANNADATQEFLAVIFNSYIDIAERKKKCQTCDRGLKGHEIQEFVDRNRRRLHKQLKNYDSNVDPRQRQQRLQNESNRLRALQRRLQEATKLDSDATYATEELLKIQGSLKPALHQRHQQAEAHVASAICRYELISAAVVAMKPVTSLREEVRATAAALRVEQEKCQAQNSSSCRTVDEINSGYLREKKQYDEIASRMQQAREAVAEAEHELKARRSAYESLRDQERSLAASEAAMSAAKEAQALAQQEASKAKDAAKAAHSAVLDARLSIQRRRDHRQSVFSSIEAQNREREQASRQAATARDDINAALAAKQQVADQVRAQQQLQLEAGRLEEAATAASAEVKRLAEFCERVGTLISRLESQQREITANLEYRQCQRRVMEVEKLLAEKKRAASALQQSEAQASAVVSRIRIELQSESEKAAELRGSRASFGEQVEQLQRMLNSEKYRDIGQRYRAKTIEAETTKLGIRDLDTSYRALDQALMHYHSLKMREINSSLKALWQTTYRGRDIDYIAIVADHAEGAALHGAARQRKQYSYRLVMYQGDTVLDMRGRCSAGQRVLASLLIRLALAETFCVRCGVLALDEPTLALDSANVRALAEALHNIIERRKAQRNFQLILITHDEEFVELLGKRDHADYYWRVAKNDSQHSRIAKVPIRM